MSAALKFTAKALLSVTLVNLSGRKAA